MIHADGAGDTYNRFRLTRSIVQKTEDKGDLAIDAFLRAKMKKKILWFVDALWKLDHT